MRAALPMYLLHEFEEHGYDFLGRRYAFQPYFCKNLVRSLIAYFAHDCKSHTIFSSELGI
ncbi:hypothetical protein J3E69DRAFT_339119 [Trichoderma sp. SZMC 28015]